MFGKRYIAHGELSTKDDGRCHVSTILVGIIVSGGKLGGTHSCVPTTATTKPVSSHARFTCIAYPYPKGLGVLDITAVVLSPTR